MKKLTEDMITVLSMNFCLYYENKEVLVSSKEKRKE
jgi:hypothetical protein